MGLHHSLNCCYGFFHLCSHWLTSWRLSYLVVWISLEGHRILLHREQTAVHSHNHQSESFLLLFAFYKQLHTESEFVVQLYQTSLVIYLLVLRITFFLRKPKAKIIPRYLVRRIWFTISFIVHCFFLACHFTAESFGDLNSLWMLESTHIFPLVTLD